jgi:predicted nucleotidyltransferase
MVNQAKIGIPDETLLLFCRRWLITELALFGSSLRTDFRSDSDVDFLVTYAADKCYLPWGEMPEIEEMEALLRRKVDWLTRKSVETCKNPLFKREVLSTAEVIYAENR